MTATLTHATAARHIKTFHDKLASIGGEQESGFEQAFSSLAYAYLKDKAPRLIDYIVGFQLVDRNEDNTKAVGVFGFKVGKQWLYAPVFFLNGDLKGHELLYIKQQDVFVPMKENWVNYVLGRKPHVLGEGSARDVYQLGGLAPNIERLSWPPSQSKYSEDKQSAAADELYKRAGLMLAKKTVTLPPTRQMKITVKPPATTQPATAQPAAKKPYQWTGKEMPVAAGNKSSPAPAAKSPLLPTDNSPITPAEAQGFKDSQILKKPMKLAGSNYPEWLAPVMPMLAAGATKEARFLYRVDGIAPGTKLDMSKVASAPGAAALSDLGLNIADFLSSNIQLAGSAWELTQKYPQLKNAFDNFHGKDFFGGIATRLKAAADANVVVPSKDTLLEQAKAVEAKSNSEKTKEPKTPKPFNSSVVKALNAKRRAIKSTSIMPAKQAAGDPPSVEVLTCDDVAIKRSLPMSDEEKQHIISHGYLVKDERKGDEVSVAYNTQVRMTLTNPHESGLYEVLESPGEFSRMLVINTPVSNSGNHGFATVVRIGSGTKNWLNVNRSGVFTKKIESAEDFRKWFDSLPDNKSLDAGGVYVAVSATGQGTPPFVVNEQVGEGEYKSYRVDFDTNISPDRHGDYRSRVDSPGSCYTSHYNVLLNCNHRPGTQLRAIGSELHVPTESFKFLQLRAPKKPKADTNSIMSTFSAETAEEDAGKPIRPGDISDIQLLFTEKTARMKLYADNNEVVISTEKRGNERLPWRGALFNLITMHGLRETQAAEMLKESQAKGGAIYRIKYAYGYDETVGAGPDSPAFPGPQYGSEPRGYNQVQSIYPQEETTPVPGLDSGRTDPNVYNPFLAPDPMASQVAQQAASQGQKEIFDTTMIAGLLKAIRQDSLVDKYLGDLMKALDRLGRILFLFYWHGEEFADRYGKSDLPELEDSIRNAFEAVGDITLFLKEKTIDPGLDDIGDPSIEETARN